MTAREPLPAGYRELADVLGSLPQLLREARRARGLSIRDTARQLNVSGSTVHRIESGEDLVVSIAARVLAWLDQTPARTSTEGEPT